MAGTLHFQVVAPDGEVLNTEAQFVVLPGQEGELGILPHHAPLMAALEIGIIRYTIDDKVYRIVVTGGFTEVSDNRVTVLAEAAEKVDTIDVARAMEAKKRAEKRLQEKAADTDILRAQLALRRANIRLRANGEG